MSMHMPAGEREGRRRTFWWITSGAGGFLSIAIGLYTDQTKALLKWTWTHVATTWLPLALLWIVSSWLVWTLASRVQAWRVARRLIVSSDFDILVDDFEEDLPSDQAVIGRQLRYLERVTDSPFLVVLLHGLGLDANDFRPYMQIAREHTAAITLFGFNNEEAQDVRYKPINLRLHAELVSGAINNLQRRYANKHLVLAGFSLGADMLFRLTEYWRERPDRRPRIHAMLLLDPNINHSSMIVSGGVAQMNPDQPLPELKRIAQLPTTLAEFHNISEYLHKISTKDLAQIRQHAADFWSYWEPDGRYDLFINRVADLRAICDRIKLVFSTHYEDHFNEIVAQARRKNINVSLFAVRQVNHFDLLRAAVLPTELSVLTKQRARQ